MKIVAVAAGNQHSMALSADGEVFTWGANMFGALGLGPRPRHSPTPSLVPALWKHKVAAIAAGNFHSGCVDREGKGYTWGHGTNWELGNGANVHTHTPQQLPTLSLVASMSLGGMHSVALKTTGHAAIWGIDSHGSLGQGKMWPRPPLQHPSPLNMLLKNVSCGWQHSAGVTSDGRLLTWGWCGAVGGGGLFEKNADLGGGQLGLGDDLDYHSPTQVLRVSIGSNSYRDLRQVAAMGHQGRAYTQRSNNWDALQASCGRNHTAFVVQMDALEPWELR